MVIGTQKPVYYQEIALPVTLSELETFRQPRKSPIAQGNSFNVKRVRGSGKRGEMCFSWLLMADQVSLTAYE